MKHELALVTDSDPISIPDWGGIDRRIILEGKIQRCKIHY
jgi:hypothetical protein